MFTNDKASKFPLYIPFQPNVVSEATQNVAPSNFPSVSTKSLFEMSADQLRQQLVLQIQQQQTLQQLLTDQQRLLGSALAAKDTHQQNNLKLGTTIKSEAETFQPASSVELFVQKPRSASGDGDSPASVGSKSDSLPTAAVVSKRAFHFDLEEIRQHFDVPIHKAAENLGVCTTVLKKICRRHGISRWPHRKIRSLKRSLKTIEDASRDIIQEPTSPFHSGTDSENSVTNNEAVSYSGAPEADELLREIMRLPGELEYRSVPQIPVVTSDLPASCSFEPNQYGDISNYF